MGALRHRLEPLLAPPLPPPPAHVAPATFGRLDLNRATAPELECLPGIGPRLAERILIHRETAGPFPEVAALIAVRGIGPGKLEQVTPYVQVGLSDPATRSAPADSAGGAPQGESDAAER